MGINEIPRAFRYVCDRCGEEHVQHNANGHYTNSLPPGWGHVWHQSRSSGEDDLKFTMDDWLLCWRCDQIVSEILQDFKMSEIPPKKAQVPYG